MILTSTGFYYSGSGAVTDLIKECSGVYVNDKFEIRLAHDPDGLSDLEYYLVNNPNRHNGSTAIKRFMRATNKLDHIYLITRYKKYVDPDFLKHTSSYLDEITFLKYPGYYHYDVWEKSKVSYIVNAIIKKITRGSKSIIKRNENNYFGITDENLFLEATQRYTWNVLNGYNKVGLNDMFFDQLVPSSNTARYIRYFNDIRVIIVDRDPRDIYFLGKYILHDKVMPKNIDDYCKWYKWTRTIVYEREFPIETISIHFEDMIYNYDETVNKILNHFCIDKERHIQIKKYFNPEISIKNTQIWNRYPIFKKESKAIYDKLEKYCYNFPYYLNVDNKKMDIF